MFIVDGFQADNINDIPPTDIQSIDVLKDASLTAVYGARGGNGVVIVTTKSAQAGKVKVDFNAYGQLSWLAGKQEMLDTYEFVKYQLDGTYTTTTRSTHSAVTSVTLTTLTSTRQKQPTTGKMS